MKIKQLIRPGHRIEIPVYRPLHRTRYRWVQGWQVFNPATGRWSVEMRYRDVLKAARDIKDIPT